MPDIKIFNVSVDSNKVDRTNALNPVLVPAETNQDLRQKILDKIADPNIQPGDVSGSNWEIVSFDLVSVRSNKTVYQIVIRIP